MTKQHYNPETKKIGRCDANKQDCPLVKDFGEEAQHFQTIKEAKEWIVEKEDKEHGGAFGEGSKVRKEELKTNQLEGAEEVPLPGLSEEEINNQKASKNHPVKYSFIEDFKEKEKKFNAEFEGIPNRFFSTDLRHNTLRSNKDLDSMDETEIVKLYLNASNICPRLAASTSSPEDLKSSFEDIQEMSKKLSLDNITEVTDPKVLKAFKTQKAYLTSLDGQTIIITSAAQNSKNFNNYRLRTKSEHLPPGNIMLIDARNLAGASRIQRRTDENIIRLISGKIQEKEVEEFKNSELGKKVFDKTYGDYYRNNPNTPEELIERQKQRMAVSNYRVLKTAKVLSSLEAAQREGENFRLQKKYIKEAQGSVASAWQDKKNYKKSHQEAMKNTRMNKYFSKIDIDDDVDLEEYEQFVKDYEDVKSKLPPMAEGKDSNIRIGIRKLGKHKAEGLYSPVHRAIMVDVHNSGSFIHELGHHYDFGENHNSSLHEDFREVVRGYSNSLKLPDSMNPKKREYYNSPTELHSRLFELYAKERLGIDNRLLDTTKHNNFDYAPFQENPELKAKGFAFLDKEFADQRARFERNKNS